MMQIVKNLSEGKESEDEVFDAVFAGIRAVMFRGLTPHATKVSLILLKELISDTLKEMEDTDNG
jgi:hypothetical protein